MKLKLIVSSLLALGLMSEYPLAFGAAKDLPTATTPADADFPKVGGNLGNQNYSSLTQINKHNLNKLGAVWRTRISQAPTTQPAPAPGDENTGQQTSALVVDGVIYIDTPVGGVAAIDGKTGAVKWKWTPSTAANGFNPSGTRRGVSVGDGKVYTLSGGNRVVALNKDTGAVVWAVQPTGPNGASLGNIAKVGTVYWDNMVYVGTNDGNRNAGFAVRSSDGSIVWSFYGGAEPGRIHTDVNGVTTNAGATWGPLQANGQSCAVTSGTSPWIHPSVDPELGMVYWSFGNVRSCGSSQDGQTRPGDNLFGNSIVAVDAKTGVYKWHFQGIRHDIADMDNVSPTVVGDIQVGGVTRKAIYYGSKSSQTFILDRTNGKPITGVTEVPIATDSRQMQSPTQKMPTIGSWQTRCILYEKLGTDNIPGSPWRAVPNYNGYQADAAGNLVYTPGNYLDVDKPFLTIQPGYVGNNGELPTSNGNGGTTEPHRLGCLYDVHFDFPVLATTTQNGGNDFSGQSFVQHRNMYVIPWAYANVAHYRSAGSNGLRAPGEYKGGGILALDATTGKVLWDNWDKTWLGLDMAHGQTTLATASDLVFVGRDDGYIVALDVQTGKILWKFQSGAGVEGGMATYSIDGEQYVVALSFVDGDYVTAFKVGGTLSELPTPVLSAGAIRQGGGGTPTPGSTTNNTVYLARASLTDSAVARDSIATGGMFPTNLGVAVGTTVTFVNPGPGSATFPNFPNLKEHCATQFFEGAFNPRLQPGQSFQYTFTREGEYWYNDCTDPRPTGRVNVKAAVVDLPGALQIAPSVLNLKPPTGIFTGVTGIINAVLKLPDGYTLDTGYGAKVTIKTPLSDVLFEAISVHAAPDGKTVVASFDKAELDNNMDAGNAVPLTVSGLFLNGAGVQTRLSSTANVRVMK